MTTLLTPEIASFVGRSARYTSPEPFGAAEFRYFALAIGDPNPLFTDTEAAQEAGYPSVIAPPTFIVETNQYMSGQPDDEGYLGHSWDIEVPGTRMIRGGHTYEFHTPLLVGDVVTIEWRVDDIVERTSRSGQQILIVTSEARYSNQRDELIATNKESLIFQELQ